MTLSEPAREMIAGAGRAAVMIIIAALVVIAVTVYAVLKGAEVRLTLILAALALGCLAGRPVVIVQTFLDYFTREQFLLPIGCCMGFAYVLRETGCDQHLVHLLLRPLQGFRTLLIPGVVVIGVLVNVPIISQSSSAIAVGSVLVPVMAAAGLSPTTTGAALILGCSIGGELLNPGAPELRTVSEACGVPSLHCIERVWPLLLVHLGVTVTLFWGLAHRAEKRWSSERPPAELPTEQGIHYLKALMPLLPLVLLFLTAMPPRLRLFTVAETWLVPPGTRGSFDSRLIGAAMLIGVVAAGLLNPGKVPQTAKVFFEGAGHALTNVVALIVAAVMNRGNLVGQRQGGAVDDGGAAGDRAERAAAGADGASAGRPGGDAAAQGLCDRERSAQRLCHRAQPAECGGGGDDGALAAAGRAGGGGGDGA